MRQRRRGFPWPFLRQWCSLDGGVGSASGRPPASGMVTRMSHCSVTHFLNKFILRHKVFPYRWKTFYLSFLMDKKMSPSHFNRRRNT